MNAIIISICVIIVAYLLNRLLVSIYLYPIIRNEFEEYKKLRHRYSNERLKFLHTKIQKALRRIDFMTSCAQRHIKNDTKDKEIKFWMKELEMNKELRIEFQNILTEVERELNARAYFNAQR